jgi:hypothetical protein
LPPIFDHFFDIFGPPGYPWGDLVLGRPFLALFYFLKNFALPNPTPIFLGFLAPPSKTGHFEVEGLGTESTIFGHFWVTFEGGSKMGSGASKSTIFEIF